MLAGAMEYVGPQFIAYGFLNQTCHVYFASDLTEVGNKLDSEEEDLISLAFSVEEFEQMMIEGGIKDSVTIAAYGLAKLKKFI